MTVRLTIQWNDPKGASVEEYDTMAAALDRLADPWMDAPDMVVLQELTAPEPTTWGRVREGDEIIAPDNSCWRLERIEGVGDGRGQVYLAAIDDGRPLTFPTTPEMPIRRRPGVLTAAVQLLHDVGLYGGSA
jgi:hypothetical protein